MNETEKLTVGALVSVLHISPTWFSDASVIGGAERYTLELARACSARR